MSNGPYRTPAEIAAEIPLMPKEELPSWWERNSWIVARLTIGLSVIQGPIVAGILYDVCKPAHVGLCWALAIVALGASFVVPMAAAAAIER